MTKARDLSSVLDLIYPVGSIYISFLSANPGVKWVGTTWVADAVDRAVVGAGGARTGGDEFGSDTHTLTTAEIPSHRHGYVAYSGTSGSNNGPLRDASASGAATYQTNHEGGDGAHSSVQASEAFYVWRRTA